jgi:peptidoglycan/xylan/chitin deacetylase (PgdA/CDA1 family)
MWFRFLLPLLFIVCISPLPVFAADTGVPILLYHRLGPTVADSMTMTTATFESHLKYLKENGYTVIPLRRVIDWYQKKAPAPPAKSVVIVEDDAHKTVYSDMLPLVKKYNVPVTVFVYPSAVSNAKYAMTWDQIRELKKTGLFDFQSHAYWHPNFKKEKKKLKPVEYEKLVDVQLKKAKQKIEKEVGGTVDLLAWPFGIYDDQLVQRATAAGYIATFTIERRHASANESILKLPRYLLIAGDNTKALAQVLAGTAPKRNVAY